MVASSTTSDKEIGPKFLRPSGCGPNSPASLLLLLADAVHRLVVAPPIRTVSPATNGMLFLGQDTRVRFWRRIRDLKHETNQSDRGLHRSLRILADIDPRESVMIRVIRGFYLLNLFRISILWISCFLHDK